jgi:sugar (pentulose or hexulose) kinase
VVGGGGDNAAGAVGVGMADAGQAMLSLGTSGVYCGIFHACATSGRSCPVTSLPSNRAGIASRLRSQAICVCG